MNRLSLLCLVFILLTLILFAYSVNATLTGTPKCSFISYVHADPKIRAWYPNGLTRVGDVKCEGNFEGKVCNPDPRDPTSDAWWQHLGEEYAPGCVFINRLHCSENNTRLSYSLQCDYNDTSPSFQVNVTCPVDCVPATTPSKCYSKQEYCYANPDAEVCSDPQPDTRTCWPSPVIIDIAGDGISLTDAAGGVNFDLDAGGNIAERLSWTVAGSDDAWLALDRNDNGRIDSGAELFGNYTEQSASPEPNGFLALAEYDKAEKGGNSDGMIDEADAVFSGLRLWQDTNHNGISEGAELHTLPELRVAELELDYKESKRTDEHGNQFRYRAKVKGGRRAEVGRWAWDVFLVSAP
ncbi:MAG TPA: hypothetical protein VN282_08910 [Pyrinomonadaceae bacterium]|nr:hypothetical protein [Pyrinomonadaceae bacterium]